MIVRLKFKQRVPKDNRYCHVVHIDGSGITPSYRGVYPKTVMYRTTSGYFIPTGEPYINKHRFIDT